MSEIKHVSHIKSDEVTPEDFYGLTPTSDNTDGENSSPVKLNIAKRPLPSNILSGEVAINFAKGHETISIKNNANEIVGFVNEHDFNNAQEIIANAISDEQNIREEAITTLEAKVSETQDLSEELKADMNDLDLIVSSALNDLNERIDEYDGAFGLLENKIDETKDELQTSIDNLSEETNNKISESELVVSSALNDLNERIIEQGSDLEYLSNKIDETNDVLQASIDNLSEETSNKINESELVTSSALNDLNKRIGEFGDTFELFENKMDEFNNDVEDIELIVSSALNELNEKNSEQDTTMAEIDGKIDNSVDGLNEVVTTINTDIDEIDLTVASSLNDLNTRVSALDVLRNDISEMHSVLNRLYTRVSSMESLITNGYECVDLGLNSGTLWASKNVGATMITDIGLYFTWGSITGYKSGGKDFNWTTYEFGNSPSITKYNSTDLKTSLDIIDDAAFVTMNGLWHIPSVNQINELFDTTMVTNEWVTNYYGSGVDGVLFTSVTNGNTLFIPQTGCCIGNQPATAFGTFIWSKDLTSDSNKMSAYFLKAAEGYLNISDTARCEGLCIRPVIG